MRGRCWDVAEPALSLADCVLLQMSQAAQRASSMAQCFELHQCGHCCCPRAVLLASHAAFAAALLATPLVVAADTVIGGGGGDARIRGGGVGRGGGDAGEQIEQLLQRPSVQCRTPHHDPQCPSPPRPSAQCAQLLHLASLQ